MALKVKKKQLENWCILFNLNVIANYVEINSSDSVAVQLKKGRPENLTCIRSSIKYNIKWLKVESKGARLKRTESVLIFKLFSIYSE